MGRTAAGGDPVPDRGASRTHRAPCTPTRPLQGCVRPLMHERGIRGSRSAGPGPLPAALLKGVATTPHTAEPAADLLQHVEAAVAADRVCRTHEAVRFEPMAALLRADRQPEGSAVVDVRCVTDTVLPSTRFPAPAGRPMPASVQARRGSWKPTTSCRPGPTASASYSPSRRLNRGRPPPSVMSSPSRSSGAPPTTGGSEARTALGPVSTNARTSRLTGERSSSRPVSAGHSGRPHRTHRQRWVRCGVGPAARGSSGPPARRAAQTQVKDLLAVLVLRVQVWPLTEPFVSRKTRVQVLPVSSSSA